MEDKVFYCSNCNRRIPHPEKRFRIQIMATDHSDKMDIILEDREVRTLIGKRAETLHKENQKEKGLPSELTKLANKNVTIQILIKEVNVLNKETTYWPNNICEGYYFSEEETNQTTQTMQQSNAEWANRLVMLKFIPAIHVPCMWCCVYPFLYSKGSIAL
ncbi:hypothetical protein POM88_009029 [Heracleum sosnowskyi]|uniref:Replication factor A C-terminal domain-containing protein n=1 Tax=Heracleum sosnowskyi TaxID=360622 RepID=A0AAD8N7Z3_9APIA|nr:hypothetical protein POM88_009029 [Heracleum sosnowskyi]